MEHMTDRLESDELTHLRTRLSETQAALEREKDAKDKAFDELARIRRTPTTWDDGHAAWYRSAEHNFKASLERAQQEREKLSELVALSAEVDRAEGAQEYQLRLVSLALATRALLRKIQK